MMGVGVEDAKNLTYWQYTAMRHVWNERHPDPNADPNAPDGGDDIEPPTAEFVRARQKRLAEAGLTGKVNK